MIKKKKQSNGELIYGIHPTVELIKAKRRKILSIYTTRPVPKNWKLIEKIMPAYPIAIQYVTRDILTKMGATPDHQGVVAWVQSFVFRKKPFNPHHHSFLVMLDSIHDPRNAGAILRSAYCTGVRGVIMTVKNSAPLNAVAIKASAGLAEHLEIQRVSTAAEGLILTKQEGYTNYLAMLQGKNANTLSFKMPLCIVIGNEAVGIAKSMQIYGESITLPQKKADVSYNASVAAGILLFMIGTQHNLI